MSETKTGKYYRIKAMNEEADGIITNPNAKFIFSIDVESDGETTYNRVLINAIVAVLKDKAPDIIKQAQQHLQAEVIESARAACPEAVEILEAVAVAEEAGDES